MRPLPGGLYRYFQSRFPRLLMHCHNVASRHLRRDKIFRVYIAEDPHSDSPVTDDDTHSPGAAPTEPTANPNSNPNPNANPEADAEVLARVVVFAGSDLAASCGCRGWWRPKDHWSR